MKKINLTIPEPCHQDWAQMTPEAQGRFCASCQKTVVDCTTMSDGQLARLFSQPGRSVCGRFDPGQLDRPLAVPNKQLPWARYFFQFTIPAFLFSLKAGAQKKETPVETTTRSTQFQGEIQGLVATEDTATRVISGRVTNLLGQPIANASVLAGRSGCMTDSAGRFHFDHRGDKPVNVKVAAPGYRTEDMVVHGSKNNIILNELATQPQLSMLMGQLMVTCVRPRAKKVPLMKPLKDTSAARYKVFPNPATAGSLVVVSFPTTADMPESIALYTATGRLVQHTPMTGAEAALVFNLRLPENLSPGTYVLQLKTRNKKGNAAIKLLVE